MVLSVAEEDRSCSVTVGEQHQLHILGSSERREISDGLASSARCGTPSHPWIIEAQLGQQINVSLLDFGQYRTETDDVINRQLAMSGVDSDVHLCPIQYGYIKDKASAAVSSRRKNVTICSARNGLSSSTFVYQSKGNSVELVLNDNGAMKINNTAKFLVALKGT